MTNYIKALLDSQNVTIDQTTRNLLETDNLISLEHWKPHAFIEWSRQASFNKMRSDESSS